MKKKDADPELSEKERRAYRHKSCSVVSATELAIPQAYTVKVFPIMLRSKSHLINRSN